MKHARFEVQKNRAGQYYWRLVAGNNETLCHSQGYKGDASQSRQSALDGIAAVQRAVRRAGILVDGEVYEVGEGLIELPEDAA